MIELHERLSEFSYGYGVTREAELLLAQCGIQTAPFPPSLIQEKSLGFDVAFNRPGAALMLQFKLGQSLTRFHRPDKSVPPPSLVRPFWRFAVDTAEPNGQFETLLKAEQDGAEVYYAAPRFTDWPHYAYFFEQGQVLDNSVLVRPSAIRQGLDDQGATDGFHRIVYDRSTVHVCSTPDVSQRRMVMKRWRSWPGASRKSSSRWVTLSNESMRALIIARRFAGTIRFLMKRSSSKARVAWEGERPTTLLASNAASVWQG